MSSDSEDDCYGNLAQKLQLMKNKYSDDKIQTSNLLDDSQQDTPKTVDKTAKITETSVQIACELIKDDSDCEDISLDTIIAANSKKKATRSSKRIAGVSTEIVVSMCTRKRFKASENTDNSTLTIDLDVSDKNTCELPSLLDTSNIEENTSLNVIARGRGRGRKNAASRGGRIIINSTTNPNTTSNSIISSNIPSNNPITSTRSPFNTSRRRRRGRQGNISSRQSNRILPQGTLTTMTGLPNHHGSSSQSFPTYSVGNTDEYPDESYNQPLFTNQTTKKDEVAIVAEHEMDLNDSLDENEELSVKVYWQSRECVRFTIRRFQKLQPIFNFFSEREKVSQDKLLFMYNDKILKQDDTPDSITYSIVKFIDGGIVNQSMSTILFRNNHITVKEGIKLKFQCQNVKKPFELYVKPEEKLTAAMIQCAEHLEKPLEKLKFIFDGDFITGKNTPKELELEGGECVDVKIIS